MPVLPCSNASHREGLSKAAMVELRVSWFKTSFIGESRHRS